MSPAADTPAEEATSPGSAPASVVAVVVTYNPDMEQTRPLLEALAAQCQAVVVVDNASTPPVAAALAAACAGSEAVLLAQSTNLGIAAAQNVGIAHARSLGAGYVLLSDQDSLPAPDMVATLLAGARRAATLGAPVGAVGPVALDRRSTTELMVYASRRWGPRRAHAGDERDGLVEAAFLLASGCLIPMDVIDAVGDMNAAWFIDHVDLEWGLRARRAGYRLYAVTAARLDHALGDSLTKLPGRAQEVHVHSPVRTYYLARNTVLLIRSGLLGWRWAVGYVVWLGKYVAFNAILARPRRERAGLMLRGLVHGVRGRTGPLGA